MLEGHGLKLNLYRRGGERADGGLGVLQVIDCRVAVVFVVHRAEIRVGVEHGLLDLHARILDESGIDTEPLLAVVRTDRHLRIGGYLLGDGLDVSRLDIKLALEDLGRPERAHLRLVAVDRSEEIETGLFQEIAYSLQILVFWFVRRYAFSLTLPIPHFYASIQPTHPQHFI